jgi:hypothetical protein
MSVKIVVHSDNETWGEAEYCTIMTIKNKAFERLMDGEIKISDLTDADIINPMRDLIPDEDDD